MNWLLIRGVTFGSSFNVKPPIPAEAAAVSPSELISSRRTHTNWNETKRMNILFIYTKCIQSYIYIYTKYIYKYTYFTALAFGGGNESV